MQRFILAIDQGTTGSGALIINSNLEIVSSASNDFTQHFPKPAWVEHDLNEIWSSVCQAASDAIRAANISSDSIMGIGITNQRETTCAWDFHGLPLSRAIVWQDRRTAVECDRIKVKGLEKLVTRKTGLLMDPYFSATKMKWLLGNVGGLRGKISRHKAKLGTIDSFLLYRMTQGVHATDVTNASRTLLMNLKTCQWDDELLSLFSIPEKALPKILPSCVEYGKTKGFLSIPDGTPITGIAGDQQAALFGQACFKTGDAKCTYGTGAFALVNTGTRPVFSRHRMLTTVAWKIGNKTTYGLEGSAFIAGAAVQWLRDGLGIIESSEAIEALAASVLDSDGVVFVPALSGIGAPHWLTGARGLITGVTRGTTRAHLARATLDGIAYQVNELIEAMGKDLGRRVGALKVDGGASANTLLMQFQADLLQTRIIRSQVQETTGFGAGLMAGIGCGLWQGVDEVSEKWRAAREFTPKMDSKTRREHIDRWNRAIKAVRTLA